MPLKMALRASFLLLLLLSGTLLAESFDFAISDTTVSPFKFGAIHSHAFTIGNTRVGEVIDDNEEMMMNSEATRRVLAQSNRYISYNAMRANRVPCNRRGRSYYNCNQRRRANPYNRGCSTITRCARSTG